MIKVYIPGMKSNLIKIYPLFTTVFFFRASLLAQVIKNPPAMQETVIQFLSQEDPLEKGSATHSGILGLPWWLSW